MVELIEVQRRTAGIDIGVDAVFEGFPFGFPLLVFLAFDGGDPGGRGGHAVEVEQARVDEFVQVHVPVVAGEHPGAGVDAPDDAGKPAQFLLGELCGLVQQHDVAEFNLFDDQALEVVFPDVFLLQGRAAAEFVLHPERIHHRGDAVHVRKGVLHVLRGEGRHGADGLGDGGRLADAAGLDDDVVELAAAGDFRQLGHQVHLEGAADAAVLQGHEALVRRAHDAAFFDEAFVNIHFADVVDHDGELDALAVGEDAVQEGGLAASQIAGE